MSNTVANVQRRDSSRFYYPDGTMCFEIPKKSGDGMKKPNITDAIELGLLPSVTTIIRTLDKPNLNRWLREQACLAVLTTPKKDGEPLDQFVNRVLNVEMVDQEEAKQAADKGTAVHAAVEDAIQGKKYPQELAVYVQPVMEQLRVMGKVVKSEFVVVGKGYAGRADVLLDSGSTLFLPDLKTTKSMPKKESWDEHRIQTAFYAAGLGNVADRHIVTGNIYISTTVPVQVATFLQEDWQSTYENACKPLLALWSFLNNYKPL